MPQSNSKLMNSILMLALGTFLTFNGWMAFSIHTMQSQLAIVKTQLEIFPVLEAKELQLIRNHVENLDEKIDTLNNRDTNITSRLRKIEDWREYLLKQQSIGQ